MEAVEAIVLVEVPFEVPFEAASMAAFEAASEVPFEVPSTPGQAVDDPKVFPPSFLELLCGARSTDQE